MFEDLGSMDENASYRHFCLVLQKDIGCYSYNETLIECKGIGSKEIGKPLKNMEMTQFLIYLEVDTDVISTVRSFELKAWVNTYVLPLFSFSFG